MRNIPFSPPDISEEEIREVVDVLRSGWITTGPKTKLFERRIAEYCGTSQAVCLNSATACLEMTLRILGIGPGDEVITSAYTYTASASVICHVGARPVLVDVAKDSYEMDYDQLEKAITCRTKAVIPVDLAGVMCDYDRVYEAVWNEKQLFQPENEIQKAIGRIAVVADAAHAFGASRHGKKCGQAADFTCFSFHAVKNLTTGEGGAVTWNDIAEIENDYIYKQYMLLTLHGQNKDALSKTMLGAWEYDILSPAYKCNMTDITAGIGLAQLGRYDGMLQTRKELIERYDEGLKNLDVQVLNHFGEQHRSSGHLYLVRLLGKTLEERNQMIEKLAEQGIATNVHYKPLPMHTAYKKLGFDMKQYPNSFEMFSNEITLPLNTVMTADDVEYILKNFRELVS